MKRPVPKRQTGDGIVDTVKSILSKLTPPTEASAKVKAALKTYGEKIVKGVTVYREPIISAIQSLINLLRKASGNEETIEEKETYDKLFHLFALVDLEGGPSLRIEMNEVFMIKPQAHPSGKESISAGAPSKKTTFNDWFLKGANSQGPAFWRYSADGSAGGGNCQDHLLTLLRANGQLSGSVSSFIKQNTQKLLGPLTKKFGDAAQSITDIAGAIRQQLGGDKIKKRRYTSNKKMSLFGSGSQVQSVLFPAAKYDEASAKAWLAQQGFKPLKGGHLKGSQLRFRIKDPSLFDHFITKKAKGGVELVIGFQGQARPQYGHGKNSQYGGAGLRPTDPIYVHINPYPNMSYPHKRPQNGGSFASRVGPPPFVAPGWKGYTPPDSYPGMGHVHHPPGLSNLFRQRMELQTGKGMNDAGSKYFHHQLYSDYETPKKNKSDEGVNTDESSWLAMRPYPPMWNTTVGNKRPPRIPGLGK